MNSHYEAECVRGCLFSIVDVGWCRVVRKSLLGVEGPERPKADLAQGLHHPWRTHLSRGVVNGARRLDSGRGDLGPEEGQHGDEHQVHRNKQTESTYVELGLAHSPRT